MDKQQAIQEAKTMGHKDGYDGRPEQADVADWGHLVTAITTDDMHPIKYQASHDLIASAYWKGYFQGKRALKAFCDKAGKTAEDWLELHRMGLADRDGEHYRLNDIGIAGGFAEWQQNRAVEKSQGIGPL